MKKKTDVLSQTDGTAKSVTNTTPVLQALEPRTLFSADLPGLTGVDPVDDAALDIPLTSLPSGSGSISTEVVFINDNVGDLDVLVRDIEGQSDSGRHVKVSVIDSSRNGVEQISALLQTMQGVNAIHIISHGTDHSVQLGDSWVDSAAVDQQATTISQWRASLHEDADLLIYGCDLASSEDGVALLNRVAYLTGTDVAASVDTTGHEIIDGNWNLEFQRGLIETEIALSEAVQNDWSHQLAGSAPVFNALGGAAPTLFNQGAAVVLDSDVTVDVEDPSASARYASASVTLERVGGGDIVEAFNITGAFQPLVEGGELVHNSAGSIGTVTENVGSRLVIQFNANASSALVNETLQSLTYQTEDFGFGGETRTVNWFFEIESSDGSSLQSVTGESKVSVSPLSAIAVDDELGELLSNTSIDLTHSGLVSNDTNLSGNTLTVVNVTDPVTGSLTSDNSGNLTYTSDAGATGLDYFDYTITDGNPDILHHWRMLDDASDETGRRDGVVFGNPTADRDGLDFDGNDSIVLGDSDYPDDFTLSFDFKVGEIDVYGDTEYFYQQGDWLEANSIHIYARDHEVIFGYPVPAHIATYVKDSADNDVVDLGIRIPLPGDDGWHNYTLTREAGVGITVYIDGIWQASSIKGDGALDPVDSVHIGSNKNDEYLDDHRMRDLRMYSEVLSTAQISANDSNQYSTATVSVELRNEEQLKFNEGISVAENGDALITSAELRTTDEDITDLPETIVYTIDATGAPGNGDLKVNTVVLGGGATFTQKDINDGSLSYTPNGGEHIADSFSFTVDDGRGSKTPGTFLIDIVPVNDAPILVNNNGLTITEGEPATTITADLLAFSDEDDAPDELNYSIVTGPSAGAVVLSSAPDSAITGFTQADINAGRVQYRHDGSEGTDASFTFELADGGEDSVVAFTDTFQITVESVNDAPLLLNLDNQPVYVKADGPVVLDADLSVSDAELDNLFASDFNGTELTLKRAGSGQNASDVFSATGSLSSLSEGSRLVYNGIDIGLVTKNSSGLLAIAFSDGATGSSVSDVMQSIAYSHPDTSPPDTVDLEWKFSDGNAAGLQGSGGELKAIGNSMVTILAAPEFRITAQDAVVIAEDTAIDFSGVNAIIVDDGILRDQRLQLVLQTTNGGLLTFGDLSALDVVSGTNNSTAITVEGDESVINVALQSLRYTPPVNEDTDDSLVIRLVPEAGLLAKYNFDGNSNDTSVGDSHHGNSIVSPYYVTDPVRGSVISFAGGGESVVVSGLYGEPTSITLAAWVDLDVVNEGAEVISLGDNVVLRADDDFTNGVTGAFHTLDGSGNSTWRTTSSGLDITGTGWRHIAYSIDESTATQRLFIDGVVVASSTFADPIDYSLVSDTVIGAHVSGAGHFNFDGRFDDLRVYGKMLTDEEIRWLANDQVVSAEKQLQIGLLAVNDAPAFLDLNGTPLFVEGGSAVILDDNVAVADPELSLQDSFDGAELTLQRAGGNAVSDDIFANTGLLGNLIEGLSFAYNGKTIGTVDKNSSGTLSLLFNGLASNADVNNTLRSITYLNSSVAPPPLVTLDWTVTDGNAATSSSQGTGGVKATSAQSSIIITPVNSVPVISNNVPLYAGTGAVGQVLSMDELLVTDVDNAANDLVYTLTSALANGVLKNADAEVDVGDTFTQADINNSTIRYTNNGIAGTDSFEFIVTDGTDSAGQAFSIVVIDDLPSELAAGITLNKDDGNDAYLYDSSNLNHVVGDSLQTWEFIFSGLEKNISGGESTLYSAATVSGHSNHLVVKQNGEVEWFMQGWPTEGLSSGLTYQSSGAAIPDLFDGEMHSIAIVFDLRDGEHYYQLYIDGKLANEVPSGWTNITVNLTADFPFVLGQKLSSVDSDLPTDPDTQLHFVAGEHFSGTYHDVRIWDSIRTPAELESNRFARIDLENSAIPPELQVNWQMTTLNGNSSVVNETGRTGANNQPVTLLEKHVTDAGFTLSRVMDQLAVDEDAPNDTVAGFVMPRDPLPDINGYQFELLDNAGGAFAIDAATGKVTVADATRLDFESMSQHQLVVRITGTDISGSAYSETVAMTVLPINEFPELQNTSGAMSYAEDSAAAVIEPGITIYDEELSASNDFTGATLTLSRDGSVNADDVFVNTGGLDPLLSGGVLTYTGVDYGSVEFNQSGELRLTFNGNATNAHVNSILRSIGYQNSNDTPPAEVQLKWLFADGNELAQGAGGLGVSTHVTTVSIVASNDAPVIGNVDDSRVYLENDSPVVLGPSINLTDPELQSDSFNDSTLTLQSTGVLADPVDYFSATGMLAPLVGGDPLVYNGTTVGVTTLNSAGLLKLAFNENATSALVNAVLSSVAYSNSSDDPAASVDLIWYFNDGNTGQQGTGGALSAQSVQNVSIVAEPDPPLLQNNQLSVSEGGAVVLAPSMLSTFDPDTRDDQLIYNISNIGNGHFAYASSPGVETVTFSQQDVINGSIVFIHDDGEQPPAFRVTVVDGSHADSGDALVDFVGVNDPPAASGVPTYTTVLEDVVSDVSLLGMSLADSDVGSGELTLTFTTIAGGLLDAHNADLLTIAGRGTIEMTVSGTLQNINNWLAGTQTIAYTGSANTNGTALDTISVLVTDNGNTGNGGAEQSTVGKIVVDILAVNDAPAGENGAVSVDEDSSYVFVESDFGFTDAIDGHSFYGVVIEQVPLAGQLTLNSNPVANFTSVSAVDIRAGLLVFIPSANEHGQPYGNMEFRVQDSGGTLNGGVEIDSSVKTLDIFVNSVSDNPDGQDRRISLIEDSEHVFAESDFGFSDVADGDLFTSVSISSLPGPGDLLLNTDIVAVNDIISTADISGGKLRYVPLAHGHGVGYSGFDFQVNDSGAQNNRDITANRIIFDVNASGDAPSGANNTISTKEDISHTFSASEFGFSDVNDNDSFTGVRIVSMPLAGDLLVNGAAPLVDDVVSRAEIDAGALQFVPPANLFGNAIADFRFAVMDDGIDSNGGSVEDPTANVMTINILPVNDAPVSAFKKITITEDSTYGFVESDFGFNDSDGHSFHAVKFVNIPLDGSLILGGRAISTIESVNVDDINAGLLYYIPDTHSHGTDYARIGFTVIDDGGNINGGVSASAVNEIRFDVLAVSDEPTGTDKRLQLTEDSVHVFSAADFGFSDEHDNDVFSGVTVLPAVGVGTVSPGILKVDGVDVTAAQFVERQALDSGALVFSPERDSFGNALATIAFSVKDSGTSDNGGVFEDTTGNEFIIDVISVNDQPVLVENNAITLHEGGNSLLSPDSLDVRDVDSTPEQIRYTVSTAPQSGLLYHTDTPQISLQQFTQADINLGKIGYRHDGSEIRADFFSFVVTDSSGFAAVVSDFQFEVVGVADAPSGTNNVVTIVEDNTYVLRSEDFGYSDKEEDDSFISLVLSEVPAAGYLLVEGQPVVSGDEVTVDQLDAGVVVYHPAPDANGTNADTIAFQVKDSGDLTTQGYNTDQSPNLLSFNILSRNDSPAGTDRVIELAEDSGYTFTSSDFGYSDSIDNDELLSVGINTLPTQGKLVLDGNVVDPGQLVAASDIDSGKLFYQPAANWHSVHADEFSFNVVDNGGVANGGSDTDDTKNTISLIVHAVNDAPLALPSTVVIDEDTSYTFVVADFGFSDVIDRHAFQSVEIISSGGSGEFLLNGVPISATQSISATELVNEEFTYVASANVNGPASAQLTYSVRDHGGTEHGGRDTSTAVTLMIDINPVNDTPVAKPLASQVAVPGSTVSFQIPDSVFTDLEDGNELAFSANLANGNELPDWLVFDEQNRGFEGRPQPMDSGTVVVMVTAVDSEGASASMQFEITIEPPIVFALPDIVEPSPEDVAINDAQVPFEYREPTALARQNSAEILTRESEPDHSPPPEVLPPLQEGTNLFAALEQEALVTDPFKYVDDVIKSALKSDSISGEKVSLDDSHSFAIPVVESKLTELLAYTRENSLGNAAELIRQFNEERDSANELITLDKQLVGGSVAVTTGLSIGYIIWLVRGGLLLSSVLTSMPAWRWVDPLPVLGSVGDGVEGDDAESLRSMIEAPGAGSDGDTDIDSMQSLLDDPQVNNSASNGSDDSPDVGGGHAK